MRDFNEAVQAVCRASGLSREDVLEYPDKRSTDARQALIWHLYQSGWPIMRLARQFGKDHSTVRYTIRQVEEDLGVLCASRREIAFALARQL